MRMQTGICRQRLCQFSVSPSVSVPNSQYWGEERKKTRLQVQLQGSKSLVIHSFIHCIFPIKNSRQHTWVPKQTPIQVLHKTQICLTLAWWLFHVLSDHTMWGGVFFFLHPCSIHKNNNNNSIAPSVGIAVLRNKHYWRIIQTCNMISSVWMGPASQGEKWGFGFLPGAWALSGKWRLYPLWLIGGFFKFLFRFSN